jgi:hypothetical protein
MPDNANTIRLDDRHVYSCSGTAYPRIAPRNRNHVHERRLPYLKRVKAKGKWYCYFQAPNDDARVRLPSPDDPAFDNAYLRQLGRLEGARVPHWQAPTRPLQIYFIGGDAGHIKIGVSANPESRLAAIQTGSPIPLRILATVLGGYDAERAYHARFAAHRAQGEWFERHPEVLAEIDRLQEKTV